MKKFTLLVLLFTFSLGFSQQVVVQNFETAASFTFAGFEGLGGASIQPDPAAGGTRMNGLQLMSVSTGNPWQGAEVVQVTTSAKLTTDKTMSIDVYATQAFTLLAKVESGSGPNSAASQSYTTPNAWQTLTFTFTQALDNTAVANGIYSKIVFFPNWKSTNDGFNSPANFTVHIDNITCETGTVTDPTPAMSATNPTYGDAGVVSSYFNDIPGFTNAYIPEGAFGSRSLINLDAEVDETIKMNFSAEGWGQYNNTTLDITAANYLHFDYYVPNVAAGSNGHGFWLMLNSGSGEKQFRVGDGNTPASAHQAIVFDSWQTVSIPMSHFTNQGFNKATLLSWKLGSDSNLNTTFVYFDNIYFTTTSLGNESFNASSIKMYPNPATNVLNIEALSTIDAVSVYNMLGQEVISQSIASQSASLDVSSLQSGIYVVNATIEGVTSSSKFVKK